MDRLGSLVVIAPARRAGDTGSNPGPSRRARAHDFYVLKKFIDLSRVRTRKPWISRRARYPEATFTLNEVGRNAHHIGKGEGRKGPFFLSLL